MSFLAPLLSILLPLASPTMTATGTDLRFDVSIAPGLLDQGDDGRLFVILGKKGGREPRLEGGETGLDALPIFGRDVDDFGPGLVAVIDGEAVGFPMDRLDKAPAGDYLVQVVFEHNRDLRGLNMPGNLYSTPVPLHIDPAKGETIRLTLDKALPAESLPENTESARFVKLPSKLLSDFHGRPMFLRAGVVLPRDWEKDTDRKYPLRVHIGGFGSRFFHLPRVPRDADAPRMIVLVLDGAGPLGDPYQVNSANHGPYGDALTKELIPYVESTYRGLGEPRARVLDGGSTGGWVSLALQIFYPDFFNGAWSSCPDGVDFRSFQLVNIYDDANAYVNSRGFERPSARDLNGDVKYTMRHECYLENALGRRDSWTLSGGQWGSWNATYSPRDEDGRPVPLWDPKTGVIDKKVAEQWKKYDLRLALERDWPTLGPKLRGKLHIWVGESDDFFLNNAVHRLDSSLSRLDPPADALIAYGPGKGHCWRGISDREMLEQMKKAIESGGQR